jgi:lipopolysaccharide transport system permease protein
VIGCGKSGAAGRFYFLAWRDIKVRYKQAVLGVAWAVLQPLFTMITFAFFFGRLAGIPSDGVPYPLFSFSALLLWTYFSVTLTQVGNSLVTNSSLITKIYFPRVLLPASAAVAGLVDMLVTSFFLAAVMICYHVTPRWTMLLAPLFVAQTAILVMGAVSWRRSTCATTTWYPHRSAQLVC